MRKVSQTKTSDFADSPLGRCAFTDDKRVSDYSERRSPGPKNMVLEWVLSLAIVANDVLSIDFTIEAPTLVWVGSMRRS